MSTSQTIYSALQNAGVDVLLDDRKDRAVLNLRMRFNWLSTSYYSK